MTLEFAARHTMDSPEWYTPTGIVEAARRTMGGIDVDPASHEEANLTVKAERYFSKDDDGLSKYWHGRVFLNPPGGLVPNFWRALLLNVGMGATLQVVWVGYSLEQLQTLQQAKAPTTPLDYPICVVKKRISFVENEAKRIARLAKIDQYNEASAAMGGKIRRRSEKADSPSHSNYVTYIGPNVGAFVREFSPIGQVRR